VTLQQDLIRADGSFDVDEAYHLCEVYTRDRARNFYYAFSILPAEKRRAILAAYSFAGEADDISDGDDTPEEKLLGLRGLTASLHAAAAGEPKGPLWVALGDAVRHFAIPVEHFDELVRGCEMDLVIDRYETFGDLWVYCYHVASLVGLICVSVFGYTDPRAKEYAVDLGIAMQVTNIMRDVREDAARGRIYLPLEDLRRFEVPEQEILDGVYSDRFRALMEFEAARAEEYFQKGERLLALLDTRSRMCVNVMRGVYHEILERMADSDYDVFARRVTLAGSEKVALIGRLWVEGVVGVRHTG